MEPTLLRSIAAIWPEILIAATIVAVTIVGLLVKDKRDVVGPALLGLAGAAGIDASLFFFQKSPLFFGMIALDPFSAFFKMVFLLAAFLVVLFSMASKEVSQSISPEEYYASLLGATLGMCLLASSLNLVMIYISLELTSISSYILTASMRESRRSSEAGLKYSLYGAIASGVMIYGMSLLYGMTGSLYLTEIGTKLQGMPVPSQGLIIALMFVLVGFGFKISMVPFHMWAPDVYEGAPLPITAFLSVGPKAAGFAVLIRFLYTAFANPWASPGATEGQWFYLGEIDWPDAIAWLAALTMTVGNLAAIAQTNLKRLLAYSSIAQAGYILVGVVCLSSTGLEAVLFYVAVYLFMNLGAFLVVMVVKNHLDTEELEGYKGLGVRAPLLAAGMTIFLFALTGIPPLSGFVGKVLLFGALIKEQVYWLAVVGVLNSVVSLYYYAGILKKIYLESIPGEDQKFPLLPGGEGKGEGKEIPSPLAGEGQGEGSVLHLSPLEKGLLIALLGLTILFGLWPTPLMELARFSLNIF